MLPQRMMMAAGNPANRSTPQAQDTGWVIAGAGANVTANPNGDNWNDPSNITADDGTDAYVTYPFAGGRSDELKASSFSLSIPPSATIDGIEVRAQHRNPNNYGGDQVLTSVKIGKNDSTLTSSKNPNAAPPSSYAEVDIGGNTDLWGLSWTTADVNSSNFQVRIQYTYETNGISAYVDAIWVKVYYTA